MRVVLVLFCLMADPLSAGPVIQGLPLGGISDNFSSDDTLGTTYITTSSGSVFRVTPQSGESEFLFHTAVGLRGLQASPSGRYVTASSWDGVLVWDRTRPDRLRRLLPPDSKLIRGTTGVSSISINRPGTMAIVHLEWSDREESWTRPFLATFPGMVILRALPEGAQTGFNDEGTRLAEYTPDYDGSGTFQGYRGKLVDWEGRPVRGEVAEYREALDERPWDFRKRMNNMGLFAPFEDRSYGWNEFGLVAMTSRSTSDGHTDRTMVTLVPGRTGGPDLPRFWDWRRYPSAMELGFRPQFKKDNQSITVARVDQQETPLWTKRFLGRDRYTWAQVSPDGQRALLLLNRPRMGPADQIRDALLLRTVDWTTGEQIGTDVPVPDLRVERLMDWNPDEGWIAFASDAVPTLYWPAQERWTSWSGLSSYRKGVKTTLAPADFGGVVWTVGTKVQRWGAAPGQIGGPVALALRPDQAMFFEVDESGQSFIRRLRDGAVLARAAKGEALPDLEALLVSVPEETPAALPTLVESRFVVSDKYRAP